MINFKYLSVGISMQKFINFASVMGLSMDKIKNSGEVSAAVEY